jgi:thiamine-phosphate pyrophosphorylase
LPSQSLRSLSPLCAIVDADIAARSGFTPPALARAYLAGGARFLQLRAKSAPSGLFLQWADEMAADARAHQAVLIVNDRFDIAWLAGVPAIHHGQDARPVAVVRKALGPEAIIGLSTHTPEQIADAVQQPISYLAIGPVFGTATKDTGYQAVGLGRVRAAALAGTAAHGIPLVAIGGITLDQAKSVIDAGAASVAVISDLLATGNPEQRAREYLRVLAGETGSRVTNHPGRA